MSDYMSRGRDQDVARSSSTPASVEAAGPAPSPAELAHDSIVAFDRETTNLRAAIDEVRSARDANNVEHWRASRARLDVALRNAARSHERARGRGGDAALDVQATLATAERQLGELATMSEALHEAPLGFKPLRREAELVRVLAAPLEGGFKAGYVQKEADLRTEIAQLDPAETRALKDRLTHLREKDPLTPLFQRLSGARQRGVLAYLEQAPRREAVGREAARRTDSTRTISEGEADERFAEPAPAPVTAPPEVIEVEPLDSKLRRMLEGSNPEDTMQLEMAHVFDLLDGSARRELARRLERYRQGSGDEVAARFSRLERPVRQRLDDPWLLKAVLASPHLDRIRSLRLPVLVVDRPVTRLNRITDADLELLAASPHLRGLRHLDLEDETALTVRGFHALAASPNLPELSAVRFDVNRHSPAASFASFGDVGPYASTLADRPLQRYAAELEARHGRIAWLHPVENYGTETPDLEAVVEHPVARATDFP